MHFVSAIDRWSDCMELMAEGLESAGDAIFLQVHKTVISNIMINQVSSHRDYENNAIEVMFTTN